MDTQIKNGRMTTARKRVEKAKALQMFSQGISNKDISEQLEVSYKTVCKWIKSDLNIQNIQLCEKRLNLMLQDETASPEDIKKLFTVFVELKKNTPK